MIEYLGKEAEAQKGLEKFVDLMNTWEVNCYPLTTQKRLEEKDQTSVFSDAKIELSEILINA